MTILVTVPGWDWTPVFWTGGIVLILFVWAVLAAVGYTLGWWSEWVPAISWVAALGVTLFGMGGAVAVVHGNATTQYNNAVVAELEDAGFSNVDLAEDHESFVASENGEYFRGALITLEEKNGTHLYQVAEVVAVEQ